MNKVHGFSTGPNVVFTLRSGSKCRGQTITRNEKASARGRNMVGAVGIEPTTSPV